MKYARSFLALALAAGACVLSCGASAEEYVEELAWQACVMEARRANPDLVSSLEKVKQATAQKEITRSAALPQVTGSASELTTRDLGTPGAPAPGQVTAYEYGISGRQLLFDGFKTSYDLSAAERNIISSRYSYDVTSSNIRLNLRTSYVELLRAQELVKVTAEIAERRKQNYELVRLRYEGGREHKGSVMTAEADLAQADYEVSQAGRNVYLCQRRLTKQLGRTFFVRMKARGDFTVAEEARERPDFEYLAETTPLLRQLIAQREAAKYGVRSAYAQFFPQIYGTAGASNSSTRWPPEANDWSIGTTATLNIFDGGNMIANVSKTKAALGQAQADEKSGRDGVIFTLSDAWTKLQNACDFTAVQKKYLDATEERARISRAQYSIGLLSFDNWIIIENNLVTAQKNFVNAEADALIAEANWIQAKGGTLDYDR